MKQLAEVEARIARGGERPALIGRMRPAVARAARHRRVHHPARRVVRRRAGGRPAGRDVRRSAGARALHHPAADPPRPPRRSTKPSCARPTAARCCCRACCRSAISIPTTPMLAGGDEATADGIGSRARRSAAGRSRRCGASCCWRSAVQAAGRASGIADDRRSGGAPGGRAGAPSRPGADRAAHLRPPARSGARGLCRALAAHPALPRRADGGLAEDPAPTKAASIRPSAATARSPPRPRPGARSRPPIP